MDAGLKAFAVDSGMPLADGFQVSLVFEEQYLIKTGKMKEKKGIKVQVYNKNDRQQKTHTQKKKKYQKKNVQF